MVNVLTFLDFFDAKNRNSDCAVLSPVCARTRSVTV
jgi:hypothetical protein